MRATCLTIVVALAASQVIAAPIPDQDFSLEARNDILDDAFDLDARDLMPDDEEYDIYTRDLSDGGGDDDEFDVFERDFADGQDYDFDFLARDLSDGDEYNDDDFDRRSIFGTLLHAGSKLAKTAVHAVGDHKEAIMDAVRNAPQHIEEIQNAAHAIKDALPPPSPAPPSPPPPPPSPEPAHEAAPPARPNVPMTNGAMNQKHQGHEPAGMHSGGPRGMQGHHLQQGAGRGTPLNRARAGAQNFFHSGMGHANNAAHHAMKHVRTGAQNFQAHMHRAAGAVHHQRGQQGGHRGSHVKAGMGRLHVGGRNRRG